MPSIEAVEQFKTIVQGLSREPEIRAQQGLPPEEILPPASQLDDLADLLGGMPGLGDSPSEASPASETEENPASSDLDDLFGAEPEEAAGPSLDDLLGPATEPDVAAEDSETAAPELETFDADFGDLPADDFGDLLAPPEDAPAEPEPEAEPEPFADLAPPAVDEFDELGALDDLLGPSPASAAEPAEAEPAFDDFGEPEAVEPEADPFGAGVDAENLDDAFFDASPAEDDAGTGSGGFDFGGDADFPELAGFADTKAEDVEAFDANKEADEFQLGDFESQFGITADDHTDAEVLNPAQAVAMDVEAGQRSLSLSDSEFESVQRGLGTLPLNLRLAVEELIGEKEVVFDDLDRVVRMLISRAPARQLANTVGRILGRKIVIPAGFEKGSGAELEARQSSLWFNLRTIMFPVLRVAAVLTVVAAALVLLFWNFIWRPLKANDLYDRGLVALHRNDGATADDLFAEAYYEWPARDRFFQYAEAYQDTGDYDRARRKYLELLQPSVRPYRDEDKAALTARFGVPLAPPPKGLNEKGVADWLAAKKQALDAYYAYVTLLLSSENAGAGVKDEIPGEVVLGNPDPQGILDYSKFETDFGFDGRDREGQFRRADAVLQPLLAANPGSKPGLLRSADNFLAWSKALSSKAALDNANSSLSEYLRRYGYDAPVTWRFVRVFLLEDQETELLKFRDRIDGDKKLAMDGETMAHLAKWLIDRENEVEAKARTQVAVPKSIEDEYGVLPVFKEAPEAPQRPIKNPERYGPPRGDEGGGGGEGEQKFPELDPPYKYPNSTEPYRPDYLEKVSDLLLRAMDTEKSLPELHYQLSRLYRHEQDSDDERKALAAADAYFQRLEPRKARLNGRPEMRMATSNRIGEIFDHMGQPLQAEKYYLDAQKTFETGQAQGLLTLDAESASVYRNLGNLYYRQTPGVEATGSGKVPGGWDQALQLFETAEQGHVEEPPVTYRLGVIEYERQDFAAAVKRFFALDGPRDKGEVSGRDNANLLYSMGNALFRSGNYASAEGYYRELLAKLNDQRSRIKEWDPVGRSAHKALAQRIYETWNNLAAAQYRAANVYRAGTPEFRQAIAALTTARAQAQILGRDLFEDQTELDVTRVDEDKLEAIRADEAHVLAMTRKEKGLVEANLKVLSLIETAPFAAKEALAERLEIFARIPLELDQAEAP